LEVELKVIFKYLLAMYGSVDVEVESRVYKVLVNLEEVFLSLVILIDHELQSNEVFKRRTIDCSPRVGHVLNVSEQRGVDVQGKIELHFFISDFRAQVFDSERLTGHMLMSVELIQEVFSLEILNAHLSLREVNTTLSLASDLGCPSSTGLEAIERERVWAFLTLGLLLRAALTLSFTTPLTHYVAIHRLHLVERRGLIHHSRGLGPENSS
jgi:hypothetical protein